MVEFYIENKLVDIDDEFNIFLNKELYSTNKFKNVDLTYSYSINIPTTINNNSIFNFKNVDETRNKFGRIYNAQIYVDGQLIIDGKYMHNEINDIYYSGNIFIPSPKTLQDIFGDKKLNEIKKYEVEHTGAPFIAGANLDNNHKLFKYPYILYNVPYNSQYFTNNYPKYVQDAIGAISLEPEQVLPAFNLTEIIKHIFESYNLNISGNIFNNEIFNKLFFNTKTDYEHFNKFNIKKFYIKNSYQYMTFDGNDVDSTLKAIEGIDGYRFWQSELLNTTTTKKLNEHQIYNKNDKRIRIPQDGWYRIKLNGSFIFNSSTNVLLEEPNRVPVSGAISDYDNTSLLYAPFEIQLNRIKSTSTTPNRAPLGIYGFTPSNPNTFEEGKTSTVHVMGIEKKRHLAVNYYNNSLFPQQNKTLRIKDSSQINTEDFIMGAHFGHTSFYRKWGHANIDRMKSPVAFIYNNPNPTTTNSNNLQSGDDWYVFGDSTNNNNPENQTYDYKQANAMMRVSGENVLSHQKLDYDLEFRKTFNNGKWSKTFSNAYNSVSYNGISNNTATVGNEYSGDFNTETLIWLEAGDMLDVNAIIPLHEYGIKVVPSTYIGFHTRKQTCPQTIITFDLEIGLVNINKSFTPLNNNNTIPSFNDAKTIKKQNIFDLLPNDITVNDFINSVIDTFNLTLQKIDVNSYSMDYYLKQDYLNKIYDLNDLIDIHNVKYKKLENFNGLNLNFNIDTSEEGYSQVGLNNITPAEYDGSAHLENINNLEGEIININSIFSYNWYKEINFDKGMEVISYNIPVITPAEIWSDEINYLDALDKGLFLDMNLRLFYINDDAKVVDLRMLETDAQGNNEAYYIPFLIPTNTSGNNELEITFDINNKNSITNKLFDIKFDNNYIIEVPVYLPNNIFKNITAHDRIRYNDNLYKIIRIENYDPTGENLTNLILLSE